MTKGDQVLAGVDIETVPSGDALSSIMEYCLDADERALILGTERRSVPQLAGLVFSAKETLFKLLYPRVGRYFGFDTAKIRELPTSTTLRLYLTSNLGGPLETGKCFEIRIGSGPNHVLTWAFEDSSFWQT
ncbi:MAG: 4'-phosphopantetheinyl transferase superfamily protein [Hyphomonadaceae bacterium]